MAGHDRNPKGRPHAGGRGKSKPPSGKAAGRPAGGRGSRPDERPQSGPGAPVGRREGKRGSDRGRRGAPGPTGRSGAAKGKPRLDKAAPGDSGARRRPFDEPALPQRSAIARRSADNLVYGRNAVKEALRGIRGVQRVTIAAGGAGEVLLAELSSWAREYGVSVPLVRRGAPEDLSRMTGSDGHQGIVAETDPYPYTEEAELLERDLIVVLDRIQDPHNLGAVIRSAEATEAAVVIPRHRSAEITASVVKASAGATEHAVVAQVRNLTDFLAQAKAAGFWVYGATAEATDRYDQQDLRGKTVLVLGSEGTGLGRRVQEACDVLIRIPLRGTVDSLNVSVAAAVLLFEAQRQRLSSGPVL